LKHINYRRKQQPIISSNENGKKPNITIPHKKDLSLKKNKIGDINTQYISRTSDYVKLFSKRKTINNDVEYNKTMSS
jgi:hypothetical protein